MKYQDVSHLVLAPPTGGPLAAEFLAHSYYLQYIGIAKRKGMQVI
jgi:hypothetical protein